jgi:hypothetical protein
MKINRRGALVAVVGAVAVVAAATFASVALADSAGRPNATTGAAPSPSASGSHHSGQGKGNGDHRFGGFGGFGGPRGFGGFGGLGGFGGFGGFGGVGGAGVVHGQFTVRTKTGFVTEDFQTGTVTARSAHSVTVKSADGYVEVWTLGAATTVREQGKAVGAAGLKVGETVRLIGTGSSGGTTARVIQVRPAGKPAAGAAGSGGEAPSTPSSTQPPQGSSQA